MCLLVLAWHAHPRYRLVVAANRDEYHDRPAEGLGHWPAPAGMLAGRDLRAGGTWLGVDRHRRFGIVTNFRELPQAAKSASRAAPGTRCCAPGIVSGRAGEPDPPTRGSLIPGYLSQGAGAGEYLSSLEHEVAGYGGFNLLLADEALWYGSNRVSPFARRLPAGVHGLSNGPLDAPWPKLLRVRARFEAWLRENAHGQEADSAALFALLDDRRPATEAEGAPMSELLPEREGALSAPFVQHPLYGTRCSTVVLIETSGVLRIAERRFDPDGRCAGQTEYRLRGAEWPD